MHVECDQNIPWPGKHTKPPTHCSIAQENDYMVPFSPDRVSAVSDPAAASPQATISALEASAGGSRESIPHDKRGVTAETKAVGDGEVGATTMTTLAPAVALSAPAMASQGVGGGNDSQSAVSVKEFCFSDDDDDEVIGKDGGNMAEESSKDTTPVRQTGKNNTTIGGGAGEGEGERGVGGDLSESGITDKEKEKNAQSRGGRRNSHRRSTNVDSSAQREDDNSDDKEAVERGRGSEVLLDSLRLQGTGAGKGDTASSGGEKEKGEGKGGEGEERGKAGEGIVATTGPTPGPGTWAPPDFGFSSDDDLDLDLSISDSSSRSAEERGEDEHTPPPSSSPMPGSSGGFDSNSAAS